MFRMIGYVPGLASHSFQISPRASLFSGSMPSTEEYSIFSPSSCVSILRCATMMSCWLACALHR